ncbi:predicted protein [Botrytis cinerea T4]|uniref:Uncharacterized protein n=1 Tax=Botryotinia fuckeliana (strain T4) TaxID=999810 RepID=G2YZ90_BOTF4|nr:predicted protein [Botrytis cinerea T4]
MSPKSGVRGSRGSSFCTRKKEKLLSKRCRIDISENPVTPPNRNRANRVLVKYKCIHIPTVPHRIRHPKSREALQSSNQTTPWIVA